MRYLALFKSEGIDMWKIRYTMNVVALLAQAKITVASARSALRTKPLLVAGRRDTYIIG